MVVVIAGDLFTVGDSHHIFERDNEGIALCFGVFLPPSKHSA